MGKRRRRLAFPKQWRVDVARQPMKVLTAMAEKKILFACSTPGTDIRHEKYFS
jgi:hypothetical protein